MGSKQPSPRPPRMPQWSFSSPRPPKPGETADDYCRACDCVRVGDSVYPRRYLESARKQAAKRQPPLPTPNEIIKRGGATWYEFAMALLVIALLFAVYAVAQ